MNILGAILAGGQSNRFGSDKAQARHNGVRLIDHVAAALSPQCLAIVVIGRDESGYTCAKDRPAANMGPLAGLAGALAYAQGKGFDHVLSVGTDTLGIPHDLCIRLQPAPSYIAGQPIIGLWPVTALALIDQILANDGRRSMRHFTERLGARLLVVENAPANINTPEDLENFKKG
jgi:molybdenum cofactor guanylyltransferase